MIISIVTLRPPPRRSVHTRRLCPPRAAIDVQESAALVGKGLGLFVLFTSTMNWWFYRRTREDFEKKDRD